MSSIDRLRDFKVENLLSVTCMDFKKSIKKHKKDLMYLDPPYLIESQLYGNDGKIHKNFDHQGLAKILKKDKKKKWILSYNNIVPIRELYKGHTILEPKWSYSMATDKKMSEDKKSRELLIFSKDIKIDLDENGELLEITYI
jgi:DNA adenine methylase